jgi:flavin reductase (DIM6/NTAB) family NADH-FMN oxidoreductase RutF
LHGSRPGTPAAPSTPPLVSFFNVFGNDPATVGIGIGSKAPREPKDTRANIRANEQFVVNLVPFSLAQEMRITSIAFPKGVEEAKEAKLSLTASERVEVPRIAQAPVSMECTLMQEVRLGSFSLVLGQILLVHVHDEAVIDRERQYIDAGKLEAGARRGGHRTVGLAHPSQDRHERGPVHQPAAPRDGNRDQVKYAKPDPDLFLAAAERLNAPIETAVVVGDSIWDMLAAVRCRALGVGLLSGGYGPDELRQSGAFRVYEDPADLLRRIDEVGGRR